MKRSTSRIAALAAVGTVAAAFAVAAPASAAPNQYAPSIGTAIAVPVSGSVATAPVVRTSALCPAGTTGINGFVDSAAAGLVEAVAISSNTTQVGTSNTSGINFSFNLLDIAASQGKVLVNGTYDLSVVCLPDFFGTPGTGQFDGTFIVSGGATPTAAGTTFTFQAAAVPATTTTLTATPAGPITQGASVTLTANVAATGATPAGTVQFKADGANLGTPVTLAAGSATLTTTAIPTGNPVALTAEFVPATPATTAGSTSNTVNLVVNGAPQATTLSLASAPAAPTTADVVTVTASVSSTGPVNAGSVTFTETGSASPVAPQTVAVTAGQAVAQFAGLTAGSHTFSASFADAGTPQRFLPSGPVTTSVTVTAFAGASATENITTSVGAGTITITAGGTVALGQLAVNPANTLLVSATGPQASLNTVTVTDTRAGALGYTVSGQVTDFSGPGTAKINGENLGWAPFIGTAVAGVVVGPTVAPGNGVAVGASTGAGLKTSRLLASAPAGSGFGTSTFSAVLSLTAPTSTPAGNYSATLTLTAL